MTTSEAKPTRLLTFASGGWVIALTAILTVVVVASVLVPALRRHAERPPGDGADPASYGFALTPMLVSADTLVPGQAHRDLLKALVDPPTMPGSGVVAYNEAMRGKYIVPKDLVIGVRIADEARAYPLHVMNLHEIANDTLGGVPIAVTYSPLCDSAVVFERRVGDAVLEFGVSGLVSNSNLLMYDRHPAGSGESLWSQLRGAAVTGPAAEAGHTLRRVPAVITHWERWLAAHPDTTVLDPDPQLRTRYKETNYVGYFRSPDVAFPIDHRPATDSMPFKTQCVVVFAGDAHRLYDLPSIADRADANGVWTDEVGGTPVMFRPLRDPIAVEVTTTDGRPADVVNCLWFAWHAIEPEIERGGQAGAQANETGATGG